MLNELKGTKNEKKIDCGNKLVHKCTCQFNETTLKFNNSMISIYCWMVNFYINHVWF